MHPKNNMESIPQPTDSMNMNDQMFYDMPRPEIPEVAFGVESKHIMFVAQMAGNIAVHAPESLDKVASYTKKTSQYKEEILRMAPLLEKVVQKEEITQTDVRPYRAVIKDVARQESTIFRWAEKATNFLSFFGIRKPKRMLNNYVEKKFVERVPEMMSEAVSYVKKKVDMATNFVEKLFATFNPTEQATIPEPELPKLPESWKSFINSSKDFIPANVREEFMSAVKFVQSITLQENAKEEYKKSETKAKTTSKMGRKEVLNRFKTYFTNRRSHAQSRAQ